MGTLEKLKLLGVISPFDNYLPTIDDIIILEDSLAVSLPESYKDYLLNYSNLFYGGFELYKPFLDNSRLDMIKGISDARINDNLPENLIPFLYENGDYYCFDLNTNAPDFGIIYWSHNGQTNEKWVNFLDWVERCWIGERENQTNDLIDGFF